MSLGPNTITPELAPANPAPPPASGPAAAASVPVPDWFSALAAQAKDTNPAASWAGIRDANGNPKPDELGRYMDAHKDALGSYYSAKDLFQHAFEEAKKTEASPEADKTKAFNAAMQWAENQPELASMRESGFVQQFLAQLFGINLPSASAGVGVSAPATPLQVRGYAHHDVGGADHGSLAPSASAGYGRRALMNRHAGGGHYSGGGGYAGGHNVHIGGGYAGPGASGGSPGWAAEEPYTGPVAKGVTNDPNMPQWAALGPNGELIAGNRPNAAGDPESTTKAATFLTINSMMAKGELPADFLQRHHATVMGMMQQSNNEYANRLGEIAAGSRGSFIARMNQEMRARGIAPQEANFGSIEGMTNGNPNHHATAVGLAKIGLELNKDFASRVDEYMRVQPGHTGYKYHFHQVPGLKGFKTGTGGGSEGLTGEGIKAGLGIMRNGGTFGVLESRDGAQYQNTVAMAANAALHGSNVVTQTASLGPMSGSDVAHRISYNDSNHVPGFIRPTTLHAEQLPDSVRAQANPQGWVAVLRAEAAGGAAYAGGVHFINIHTGATRSFAAVGGGYVAGERNQDAATPGAVEADLHRADPDGAINALIGVQGVERGHRFGTVTRLVSPLNNRDGLLVHAAFGNRTHGCIGLLGQENAVAFANQVLATGVDRIVVMNPNAPLKSPVAAPAVAQLGGDDSDGVRTAAKKAEAQAFAAQLMAADAEKKKAEVAQAKAEADAKTGERTADKAAKGTGGGEANDKTAAKHEAGAATEQHAKAGGATHAAAKPNAPVASASHADLGNLTAQKTPIASPIMAKNTQATSMTA